MTKSAIPTSVPEPGGPVFFTIVVDNTGQEQVTITDLVDNPGAIDLDGLGGCSVPQTIPPGGRYTCSFPGTVSGNGGETVFDTVTATGQDDDGNTLPVDGSVGVAIEDLIPSIDVVKSANPTSVQDPGDDVDLLGQRHQYLR